MRGGWGGGTGGGGRRAARGGGQRAARGGGRPVAWHGGGLECSGRLVSWTRCRWGPTASRTARHRASDGAGGRPSPARTRCFATPWHGRARRTPTRSATSTCLPRPRLRLRLLDRARRARGRGRHAAHLRPAVSALARYKPGRSRSRGGSCASRTTPRSTTSASAGRCPTRGAPGDASSTATTRTSASGPHSALSTLPEDQRLVIVLRFVVGLTPGRGRHADGPLAGRDPRPAAPRPPRAEGRARAPARRAGRDGGQAALSAPSRRSQNSDHCIRRPAKLTRWAAAAAPPPRRVATRLHSRSRGHTMDRGHERDTGASRRVGGGARQALVAFKTWRIVDGELRSRFVDVAWGGPVLEADCYREMPLAFRSSSRFHRPRTLRRTHAAAAACTRR